MDKKRIKTKRGAASFYIVAISTLVLVIVAASFAAIIISEIARTSNNDLAQSAYDSAMAGVEDAKLAYYKCANEGNCGNIVEGDCYAVARALGRIREEEEIEVPIQESNISENNMQQAYTCLKMKTDLDDHIVTTQIGEVVPIKVELKNPNEVPSIDTIGVSWGAKNDIQDEGGTEIETDHMPILALGVIQTADSFELSDFDMTKDGKTDRGMLFLKPSDEVEATYSFSEDYLLKSNDKTVVKTVDTNLIQNKFLDVKCGGEVAENHNGMPCYAEIGLPEAVGGGRNKDTFIVAVALIGQGTNEGSDSYNVRLQFCGDGGCTIKDVATGEASDNSMTLATQIEVDSTGRANDIYRRVSTRLGTNGGGADSGLFYAVMAENINKISDVICEANFAGGSDYNNCE